MKKRIPYLLSILSLAVGALLLSLPTYNNSRHQRLQHEMLSEYLNSVTAIEPADFSAEYAAAKEYNDLLTGQGIKDPFLPNSGFILPEEYHSILNIDGVMGSVEVPSIDINLMIYHGTSDEVLEKGVGHLEATALPIGGEGTHSVLTAHSGQAKAKQFTDLNKVKEGEVFYIHVLDMVLAYEVDQIMVIHPNNTEALRPVRGEDYVTLITCTPYGINSHRLLVRGHRIEYTQDDSTIKDDDAAIHFYLPWQYLVSGSVLVLCSLAVFITLIRSVKLRKKK